jgi:hypothetical protein
MQASDFFALASLRRSTVVVNGQTIHVREMSVAERAKLLSMADKDAALSPAFLVQSCVINEDGSPVFSEKDEESIRGLSPSVVDSVATAVMKLSRLEDEAPNV